MPDFEQWADQAIRIVSGDTPGDAGDAGHAADAPPAPHERDGPPGREPAGGTPRHDDRRS